MYQFGLFSGNEMVPLVVKSNWLNRGTLVEIIFSSKVVVVCTSSVCEVPLIRIGGDQVVAAFKEEGVGREKKKKVK